MATAGGGRGIGSGMALPLGTVPNNPLPDPPCLALLEVMRTQHPEALVPCVVASPGKLAGLGHGRKAKARVAMGMGRRDTRLADLALFANRGALVGANRYTSRHRPEDPRKNSGED